MSLQNPQKNIDTLEQALAAWREFAPSKKYGNLTLEEFEAFVVSCRTDRSDIVDNENEHVLLTVRRDNNDLRGLKARDLLVKGVVADPEFGEDSAFYEAMGYIRKSERKSGLTRRKHNGNQTP